MDLEQQIGHLEESIKDLTTERDRFKQEVALKEELEEVARKQYEANISNNKEIENICQQYEQLDMQFNLTKNELKIARDEKESYILIITELETEKQNIVETLTITGEKLNEVNKKLDEKYVESERLRQKFVELENTLLSQDEEFNAGSVENKLLKEKLKTLEEDKKYFDEECKNISNDNAQLKENYQRVNELKTEIEIALQKLNVKFASLEKENVLLQESLTLYREISRESNCETANELRVCIISLRDSINEKNQLTKSLNDELSKLECELNNELARTERLPVEQKDDSQEEKNRTDEMKLALEQKEQLEQKISFTQDLLNEKNMIIGNLNDDIEQLKQRDVTGITLCENLKKEVKYKDDMIAELTHDIEELKSCTFSSEYVNQIKKDLKEQEEHIINLQDELVTIKKVFNEARIETVNLKISEENYLNEIQEKEILLCQLKAESVIMKKSLEDYGNELTESKTSHSNSAIQCKNFETTVIELKTLLETKDSIISELTKQIDEIKNNHENLNTRAMEQSSNYELLEGENKTLSIKLKSKEDEINQMSNVVEEKIQLANSLMETLQEHTTKGGQNDEYNISQEGMEVELQSALNRIDELEQVLKAKHEANDQLQILVKESGEKGQRLRSVALKAKKELDNMRSQFQELKLASEQQVTALMEEVKRNKSELVWQKTECEKHEEQFEVFF